MEILENLIYLAFIVFGFVIACAIVTMFTIWALPKYIRYRVKDRIKTRLR